MIIEIIFRENAGAEMKFCTCFHIGHTGMVFHPYERLHGVAKPGV